MRSPLFSVLILSVPNRIENLLVPLYNKLMGQLGDAKDVEILCLIDNKVMTIGEKRHYLVATAKGKWIGFLDDDDDIADSYIEDLRTAMTKYSGDVVAFKQHCTVNGEEFLVDFDLAHGYEPSTTGSDGKLKDLKRFPYHMCFWRADVAKTTPFRDISYGEDIDWCRRMLMSGKIKTQVKINRVLHYYRFSKEESEALKTTKINPMRVAPAPPLSGQVLQEIPRVSENLLGTKLLIKYPTRSRPQKFINNIERYIETSSSKIRFVISMDTDDATMNNPEMIEYLKSKNSDRISLEFFFGPSNGKIAAINRDIPTDDWDILIATADDMEPFPFWDKIITEDFKGDFSKALNYNTDPRLEEQGKDFSSLITLSIIGRKLYDNFGYIYHPDYVAEYCDNEQTIVLEKMGVLQHINKRPVIHKWGENQDRLMSENIRKGYQDKGVFERRMSMGFPK
jgi:hypothetical protein